MRELNKLIDFCENRNYRIHSNLGGIEIIDNDDDLVVLTFGIEEDKIVIYSGVMEECKELKRYIL